VLFSREHYEKQALLFEKKTKTFFGWGSGLTGSAGGKTTGGRSR
jgi:hypothetical protein